jgi:hypothetical protein
MADIVGEPLKSYVVKQIKDRQKAHGSGTSSNRSPEVITYLNSKTAWVKLASGVRISGDRASKEEFRFSGDNLAKEYILFGGVSRKKGSVLEQRDTVANQTTGAYNVTARNPSSLEFGLVPMPGIESAEIKTKERGSIREATVKLKAYNKEQFDIIDVLYLRLGYTVLLEWGTSLYLDGDNLNKMGYTLIEDASGNGFFQYSGSHTGYLGIIEGFRKGKKGNYDGLLGKVKNFTWSFNQDGSYDIELSIISAGDVVESLKSNITPPKVVLNYINSLYPPEAKTKDEKEEENTEENSGDGKGSIESSAKDNVISAFMLLMKLQLKTNYENGSTDYVENPSEISYEVGGTQEFIGVFVKSGAGIPGGGGGPGAAILQGVNAINNVMFGDLLQNVEGNDICYMNYNNGEDYEIFDPGFYWRFGSLLEFLQTQCVYKDRKTGQSLFKIDYDQWSNKMVYYPNQISFDPRICVVNGVLEGSKIFPQLFPWKKEDGGYAWPMSIYISFVKIQEAIDSCKDEEGNVSIFDFLSNICSSLNEALGGVNNLEPVFDEENNILRILDGSYSKDRKTPDYTLELYGYNGATSNFVRSLDLKTSVTPEFATMVTVGATADGYVKGTEATMFSRWNRGLIDRFKEKGFKPANESTANNPDEARDNYLDAFFAPPSPELALGYKLADIGGDVGDKSPQLMDDVISSNVSIATEYYKYLNAKAQLANQNFASPTLGFIPFNLGATMDGLSGIKIYNELSVDTRFLPKNYPDTLRFIITGVSHKIEGQDWETTINTSVIPNTLDRQPSYNLLKNLMSTDAAIGVTLAASRALVALTENISSGGSSSGGALQAAGAAAAQAVTPNPPSNTSSCSIIPRGNGLYKNDFDTIRRLRTSWLQYKGVPNTDEGVINFIRNGNEGGYFHPVHAYDYSKNPPKGKSSFLGYGVSGETLWGEDRFAGGGNTPGKKKEFWTIVDKYSGFGAFQYLNWTYGKQAKNIWGKQKTPGGRVIKDYKANGWTYNTLKDPNQIPPNISNVTQFKRDMKRLQELKYEIVSDSFYAQMNSEKGFQNYPELKNLLLSDVRTRYMWYRARYNGPKWFNAYAKNLKSLWNSGVKDLETIICKDMAYRYNYNKGKTYEPDVRRMADYVIPYRFDR